jgi:hypothetical protein
MNKSIISSFNQDQLIKQLITPLFNLRLNPVITSYIKNRLSNYDSSRIIKQKFGKGVDGEERFTNLFNNAVINFIYQNFRTNPSNANGELVNVPESYNTQEVKVNNNLPVDVLVTDTGISINSKKIESDFNRKVFLVTSNVPDSYAARGLDTFTFNKNPFDNAASYYKYVISREVIRANTPIESLEKNKAFMAKVLDAGSVDVAYESYISEKALKSTFNFSYIMCKTKYSYAETVLNIVNEFGDILKKNYPFVAQLSLAPNIEGAKVLTLNNKKEAQGDIATFYYKDIRNLADPTIRKVNNENDNQRISEVFEAFSLMMFYQHGVGNTSLGFTKVLDPAKFKELIKTDSANFIGNYLDESTLDKIANTVLNNQRFKNYMTYYLPNWQVCKKQLNSILIDKLL